ncbi:LexA repressor-like protein [Paenibacillus larvae subsp. larvae DSM 25430]|nr:LexA repressor-like protein [Paenibacillus larvae subsp. larvae DSM 25430]
MAPFIFWNLAFYTIIRTQLVFRGETIRQNKKTELRARLNKHSVLKRMEGDRFE